MKNFLLSIILGVFVVLPAMVHAQEEAMAEIPHRPSITAPNENVVAPVVVETPKAEVAPAKDAKAPAKIKTTKKLSKKELRSIRKAERKARRQERRVKRVKKFLNSRLGKWMVKRAIKKSKKRKERYQRKALRAAKKGNKRLQKKYEKKALTGNLKIGIILLVIRLSARVI